MPSKLRLPSSHSPLVAGCKPRTVGIPIIQRGHDLRPLTSVAPTCPRPQLRVSSLHSLTTRTDSQALSMSSMPATHGHNAACCNIPPVVSEGYTPKGSYTQVGDKKTYVTGPSDASKGLISVFDIFGYFDQTIQGADILATGSDEQQYKVFMPDWFDGNPCPIEWYPPDTEEKQQKLGEWFGKNSPFDVAAALPEYVKALQASNPSIRSWGLIGYCWGGKVVELVTAQASSNPFAVAVACHPAMVDPSGADKIGVPYALVASMEEAPETIKDFESRLKVPHRVETFGDQVHGFMAARADLSDPHVKAEYARGYQIVLEFLGKHWI